MNEYQRKKSIVILGATSSIAEHCARIWVKEDVNLILVGRHLTKVEQVAHDLRVRNPQSQIESVEADFLAPLSIQMLVDKLYQDKIIDIVLIAHGTLSDQSACQTDLALLETAIQINGLSPILFAEAFIARMERVNHGTLAVISSVAGERGRQSNYIYGAAKALVTRYAEGLQHRLAKTNVRVVLIKPGPTDTPMTAHLKQKNLHLAKVEEVAQQIVMGIAQGKAVIYTPSRWAFIMLVIRSLPRFVFNKINI